MLAHERQQAILELMRESGSIRISDISANFGVSNETARRDLEYMQKKNLLRRIHGGAVLESAGSGRPAEGISATDFSISSILQERLAQAAAEYVQDNDILFIGHGNTMYQLSRCLHGKSNITVLTNSLFVINELVGSKASLYALGGLIDPDERNMSGQVPISVIQKFYAAKAFISCGGVSLSGAVTDYNSDGTLMNLMLMHAEKRYLVASSNKFGRNGFCRVCDLKAFNAIITDDMLSEEYRDYICHLDIELRLIH